MPDYVPPISMSAQQYNKAAQDLMLEDEWQKFVEDALRHYGWTILLRFRDSSMHELWQQAKTSPALLNLLKQLGGWPDLFVAHPRSRPFWIECKTNKGVVRDNQREKIATIRAAGGTVIVLRPRHRDDIDRLLRV